MDTHYNALPSTRPTRSQKFLHFKLRREDGALLEFLPEKQRQLLLAEGSYKQISQRFGLPIGTVRSRIHRGRAALEQLRQSSISPDNTPQ
jgi:DNA-directed RNA polymerase specialized sigma24 family protein